MKSADNLFDKHRMPPNRDTVGIDALYLTPADRGNHEWALMGILNRNRRNLL